MMRRAVVAAGGILVWLSAAYPVGSYLGLRRLRVMHPELFDGTAARLAVEQAIDDVR